MADFLETEAITDKKVQMQHCTCFGKQNKSINDIHSK